MQDKRGFVTLLLNGIVLGTYGIWIRLLQHTLTGYQQVTARSFVSFLLALLILVSVHGTWHVKKKYAKHLLVYLFFFAASTILFTFAALQTTIALSVFGLYVGSILTAFVLGSLCFHETVTKAKIISIILVLAALIAFIYPFSLQSFNAGLILGLASGITDGIGSAFKKYFGGKIERPILIVLQLLSTLVIALSLSLISGQTVSLQHIPNMTWIFAILYGGFFVASSYLSLFGFQHFDLNIGTILISTELFFAPFFAFLFFGETLTHYQVLGGILLALAILIPYIRVQKLKMYHKQFS